MGSHEGYKWLIDELVEVVRSDVSADRIRQHGHAERTNQADLVFSGDEQVRRDLLLRLEPQEREIIALMLEDTRESAVHDVACFLE